MSFIDIQLNPAKATTVYFILGFLTFIRTGGLDYPLCKCNTSVLLNWELFLAKLILLYKDEHFGHEQLSQFSKTMCYIFFCRYHIYPCISIVDPVYKSNPQLPELFCALCFWPMYKLRTFALIVTLQPCCTCKIECHVMHWACTLSTKMSNDRAVAIAMALLGFYGLGRLVTPTFLFRNKFYLQLSLIVKK